METLSINGDKKEWFENWFDSKYYPMLYQNRDMDEAASFVNKLLAHLNPPNNSQVLDIACGEGRFAKQLQIHGHQVVGIDLSEKRIEKAQEMENENLRFFIHDMRLPFYRNYFDYAFNFFTSFGYFSKERDTYAAAREMSQSLKNEGILVIDYFNTLHAINNLVSEETIERSGIVFYIKRYLNKGKIIKEIAFENEQGEAMRFKEEVAAFVEKDFLQFFEKQGLVLTEKFGDYQLNEFDKYESPRLIMIFKKS